MCLKTAAETAYTRYADELQGRNTKRVFDCKQGYHHVALLTYNHPIASTEFPKKPAAPDIRKGETAVVHYRIGFSSGGNPLSVTLESGYRAGPTPKDLVECTGY
jgi:hypothetical protein